MNGEQPSSPTCNFDRLNAFRDLHKFLSSVNVSCPEQDLMYENLQHARAQNQWSTEMYNDILTALNNIFLVPMIDAASEHMDAMRRSSTELAAAARQANEAALQEIKQASAASVQEAEERMAAVVRENDYFRGRVTGLESERDELRREISQLQHTPAMEGTIWRVVHAVMESRGVGQQPPTCMFE